MQKSIYMTQRHYKYVKSHGLNVSGLVRDQIEAMIAQEDQQRQIVERLETALAGYGIGLG